MIKDIRFEEDCDNRLTCCYIVDEQDRIAVGAAMCHEDDLDMISARTGQELSYRRAHMDYLRIKRDQDLKPRLAALKQLYYSMKHSKQFNPKSYENRMLQRQIRIIEFDLTTIKEILAHERQSLKEYIAGKDKIHNRLRARNAGQN